MQVNRKGLAEAVRGVMPAVGKRPGIPALSCVEVSYDGAGLELRGTDLELTIRRSVHVEGGPADTWVALVNGKALGAALKSSTGSAIELEPATMAVGADMAPALRVGPGIIRCEPAGDFPTAVNYAEAPRGFVVEAAELAELLRAVEPAASRDAARPVLTGVLLASDGAELTATATDSYRLHVGTARIGRLVGAEPECSAIVPGRALRELVKVLGRRPAGTVSFYADGKGARRGGRFDPTGVEILAGGSAIASRIIEGEYPNWRQLLPEPASSELLKVDGIGLAGAIAGAAALGGEGSSAPAILAWSGVGLEVSRNVDGARFGPVLVDVAGGAAEPVTVGVNPAYFAGALEAAGEGARLYVRDGLKPLVFFGDRVTALVMPVRMPAIVAPDVKAAPVKAAEPWSPAQARKAPEPVEAPVQAPEPAPEVEHVAGSCEPDCGHDVGPEPAPVVRVAPEHAADGIGGTYPAGPVEPARDALSSSAITTAPTWSELLEVGATDAGIRAALVVGPDGEPWVKIHRRSVRKGGRVWDKPGPSFPLGAAPAVRELLESAEAVGAEL